MQRAGDYLRFDARRGAKSVYEKPTAHAVGLSLLLACGGYDLAII
jgi:hypothetical protein